MRLLKVTNYYNNNLGRYRKDIITIKRSIPVYSKSFFVVSDLSVNYILYYMYIKLPYWTW